MAISLPIAVFCVFSRFWGCRSSDISWVMIVVVSSPLTSPSMLLLATASAFPLLDHGDDRVDHRQDLLGRGLGDHHARPPVDEGEYLHAVGALRALDADAAHPGLEARGLGDPALDTFAGRDGRRYGPDRGRLGKGRKSVHRHLTKRDRGRPATGRPRSVTSLTNHGGAAGPAAAPGWPGPAWPYRPG